MPKWDKTRNYYADLELPPSATSDEIKRQFKKLALKYHPDRNPGREAEVNPKFQVIQSAHEILTDDNLKRQYDDARRSYPARYPTASGVRGNPWQDAGKAYPPPPRRQANFQARPASGAQRYESFTSSMPRNARPPPPKDDPQFRRSTAEAWDNIRPSSGRRPAQAPPPTPARPPPGRAPTSATRDARPGPVPVPPKTAYQKQKAQASFGARKTGFTPRSPGVADEPPVTNKNYFTNRTHSYLFTDPMPDTDPEVPSNNTSTSAAADPLAQFRDKFMENRQSTPYHTPGGEKTSLFDSDSGLGRAHSTRASPRNSEMPGTFPRTRPRSSSPTRSSSNDGGSEDSTKVNTGIGGHTNRNGSAFSSRASERYKPKAAATTTNFPPQPAHSDKAESMPGASAAQPNGPGPSVYAPQTFPPQFRSQVTPTISRPDKAREHAQRARDWLSLVTGYHLPNPSSEDNMLHDFTTLLPLEVHQRIAVDRLVRKHSIIENASKGVEGAKNRPQDTSSAFANSETKTNADSNRAYSFSFPTGADAARKDTDSKSFTRNSTENIQTRFVEDEELSDWQFKAGSVSANEATTPSRPRPQSRSRPTRRQTPLTKPAPTARMPSMQETTDDTNPKQGFSAGEWNEQIGPQHFEPQLSNSASTSPTRRQNSKKPRPVKMTAGTAGLVDEEESEGWQEIPQPPPSATPMANPMTADAMDIDTPPLEKAEVPPQPLKVNNARKIPVEPHRADWRAGDVNDVSSKPADSTSSTNGAKGPFTETNVTQTAMGATANQSPPGHGGSEDTEEFLATFSEFKKVEPFTDPVPTGLKSFADLKSTLPFESKPSEQIPVDIKPPPGRLAFPTPPVAPRLPPTMGVAGIRPNTSSFRKYAQDFFNYMDKWDTFDNKVVTHFETRKEESKLRRVRLGVSWLEDGADNYLLELDQDSDVRKQWVDACAEHRKRVAEFKEFRDRVK
ncbi:hypothetical protein F5Y19DRAFT_296979 [Xylariaceae sp. FL1651]|nr:hypothetical protein F5Y19DRAFT_296979 [Xylariaceae sp. FL1651]